MRILTPAKVNLCLRVVGKRDDGYHLIDSIIVPISLYDEVEISRPLKAKGGLTVTCRHPQVPSGEDNLAHKAASILLGKKGIHESVSIRIRKKIPVGAGLGGGSSDAAATLVGLNRYFRLGYRPGELLSIASQCGADVPFFIRAIPTRARGIGERLTRIYSFPRLWIVILFPGFPVSTRWVYHNLDFKLTKVIENTNLNAHLGDSGQLKRLLVNDLEKVTFGRYPRISSLKRRLIQAGASGALMSGSGSSVFGIFAAVEEANKAFRCFRQEKGVRAYLAHTLVKKR
ncbi:MAG: 4-(cytidine 5'-diphospho)-2-C-methyl-D-erythritol kinase [Candidatus Binatia bacterium]|nr:4-(cytidine 5'-diphospho)-2-C-methyl-D-erythritol kinase [Candidatus Binatia bacterium]